MRRREYKAEDDYKDLSEWWVAHKWPVVPQEMLPKMGMVVEDEGGVKCCAGFMYQTDSRLTWIEWVVSNPEVSLRKRVKAVDMLVGGLVELSKACGYKIRFSSLKSKGLIKIYEKHGFSQTDQGMTTMIGGF